MVCAVTLIFVFWWCKATNTMSHDKVAYRVFWDYLNHAPVRMCVFIMFCKNISVFCRKTTEMRTFWTFDRRFKDRAYGTIVEKRPFLRCAALRLRSVRKKIFAKPSFFCRYAAILCRQAAILCRQAATEGTWHLPDHFRHLVNSKKHNTVRTPER